MSFKFEVLVGTDAHKRIMTLIGKEIKKGSKVDYEETPNDEIVVNYKTYKGGVSENHSRTLRGTIARGEISG